MTRRELLGAVTAATAASGPASELVVPVHQLLDGSIQWDQDRLRWFHSRLWAETAGDLLKGGIKLQTSYSVGKVERPPFREPIVSGLRRGAINFVITAHIPMQWDGGRGLSGVSSFYREHQMCMLALSRAHLHQVPFLSVNSCTHELLHVLLGDIFESRPTGVHREMRELRVDSLATRLWLLGDGGTLLESASACVARLGATSSQLGLLRRPRGTERRVP